MQNLEDKRSKRQYPPIYEKAVPIILGLIVLGIVALIMVIFVVALGGSFS